MVVLTGATRDGLCETVGVVGRLPLSSGKNLLFVMLKWRHSMDSPKILNHSSDRDGASFMCRLGKWR